MINRSIWTKHDSLYTVSVKSCIDTYLGYIAETTYIGRYKCDIDYVFWNKIQGTGG
jgi:hypothetical protein